MSFARNLDSHEAALTESIPCPVDCSRVRLYGPGCGGVPGHIRGLVLRASRGRAIALGNHIFIPDRHHGDPAVLAHELTHCAQYQEWGPVRYYARAIVAQLRDLVYRKLAIGSSPYHYQVQAGKPFAEYGMEQQAQMVEDSFRNRAGYAMPSA